MNEGQCQEKRETNTSVVGNASFCSTIGTWGDEISDSDLNKTASSKEAKQYESKGGEDCNDLRD